MRKRIVQALAAMAVMPLLSGCIFGLIYSHTVEPLDLNLTATPVYIQRAETGESAVSHVNIPLTSIPLDILWNSNAIGDAMKLHGIEQVYYADLETLSVLRIWNEYTVHIYGKPAAKTDGAAKTGG
jgi:hypothetical protein